MSCSGKCRSDSPGVGGLVHEKAAFLAQCNRLHLPLFHSPEVNFLQSSHLGTHVCIFNIRYKPQPVPCNCFCWLLVLLKAGRADFPLPVKLVLWGAQLHLTSAAPYGSPIVFIFAVSVIKKAKPSHPHPHRDHMWNWLSVLDTNAENVSENRLQVM